jgi:hypothetical protein
MRKLTFHANSLYQQILTEWRLFWRSQETIFLTFLVPMMAMAIFIYLGQEGMLASVFDIRGGRIRDVHVFPHYLHDIGNDQLLCHRSDF